MLQGEESTNLESFRLKATDTQEARRNFSGYQVNQFVNLADLQQGDNSGTTETDEVTDSSRKGEKGYSTLNQKIKGLRDKWPVKRS